MDLLSSVPYNLFFVLVCIIGLCVGSFLTVVVYRLPLALAGSYGDNIVEVQFLYPFSCCPHCLKKISRWFNIPLISYLVLRGKSRCCNTVISKQYFLIELLSLALTALVVIKIQPILTMCFALILVWSLLALSFIDLNTYLLPDQITLPLLWLGLTINCYEIFVPFRDAFFGAITGYLSFYLLALLVSKVRGMQAMGRGDFKLAAVLGAWLGWRMLPVIILIASLTGLIIGLNYILITKKEVTVKLPFGPFLAGAGMIVLLWSPWIVNYQLHLGYGW